MTTSNATAQQPSSPTPTITDETYSELVHNVNMESTTSYMAMDSSALFKMMTQNKSKERRDPGGSVGDLYMDKEWYYGRISRQDAEKMLLACGKERAFLIRESASKVGDLAVSMLHQGRVKHFGIQLTDSHKYYIGNYFFNDLVSVVKYYQQYPIFYDDQGRPVSLGKPIFEEWEEHRKESDFAEYVRMEDNPGSLNDRAECSDEHKTTGSSEARDVFTDMLSRIQHLETALTELEQEKVKMKSTNQLLVDKVDQLERKMMILDERRRGDLMRRRLSGSPSVVYTECMW